MLNIETAVSGKAKKSVKRKKRARESCGENKSSFCVFFFCFACRLRSELLARQRKKVMEAG